MKPVWPLSFRGSSRIGSTVWSSTRGVFFLSLWLLAPLSGETLLWPPPSGAQELGSRAPLLALPDLQNLEESVAQQIRDAHRQTESLILGKSTPSDRAEALGVLARLFDAYSFDAAAETYYRAALGQQESFRWVYALAYKLQRSGASGHFAEAERLYRRAIQLKPEALAPYIHVAEVLRESNRLDEAAAILETVLQGAPGESSASALLGQIELSRRNYPRAIELLTAALEKVPEANRLHYPLALAYRGTGEQEKAAEHLALRGNVGLRPADPWPDELEEVKVGERVHILSGRMAFRAGRYTEAAELFAKAVEANPESAGARVNLGTSLTAIGKKNEAVTQFQLALAIDPDNATALFNLGRLLVEGGAAGAALTYLERASELAPTDHEARTTWAKALSLLGQDEEALSLYRQAVAIGIDNEEARVGEATMLVRLGRYAEAIASLEDTIGILGRTVPVVYALVRLLAACPESSLRDGQRALTLGTRLFEIQKTAGHAALVAQAHAEVGQCQEAANWQQKLVDTFQGAGQQPSPAELAAMERYQNGPPCRPPGDWG